MMQDLHYTITATNLHIEDSWSIPKRSMGTILCCIEYDHPESEVWQRTHTSLIHEWCVHNLCYNLHLWRSHTKDVDLDKDANGMEWLYNALGFFAWFLVK